MNLKLWERVEKLERRVRSNHTHLLKEGEVANDSKCNNDCENLPFITINTHYDVPSVGGN